MSAEAELRMIARAFDRALTPGVAPEPPLFDFAKRERQVAERMTARDRMEAPTFSPIVCSECNGDGVFIEVDGYRDVATECEDCGGTGISPCEFCGEDAMAMDEELVCERCHSYGREG